MNEIKILEYYIFPLFKSFNEGIEKSIPLFESLSMREYLFLSIFLKSFKISFLSKLGGLVGIELDLMNFLLKLSKYLYIFSLLCYS